MLRLCSEETVAIIEFDRSKKKNAFNKKMHQQFHDFMQEIQLNDRYHTVLLVAKGDDFCTGGDLNEIKNRKKEVFGSMEFSEESSKLYEWKKKLQKPIISAIQGHCLGLGMLLAAMSHICIATENSQFGLPEIKFGLAPMGIYPYLIPSLGTRLTLELALTGRFISGQEAIRKEFVHHIVSNEQLRDFALQTAKLVAKNSTFATSMLLKASAQVEQQQLLVIENLSLRMLSLNFLEME